VDEEEGAAAVEEAADEQAGVAHDRVVALDRVAACRDRHIPRVEPLP
jgi:hypothetical protein